ncbi:MAG: YraN family protein [bacterium]|nr:YraN family protein [bacterium]
MKHIIKGRDGEDVAVAFLEKAGYRVVERNFRRNVGEIDIVCRYKGLLVFVEVKTYETDFMDARYAINQKKWRHLWRTAQLYLVANGVRDTQCRFDLIIVRFGAVEMHLDDIRPYN